jgi:NAD(P)-dependent dehydrogenase (short-subunit alcohol dehydrogenase family)
MAAVTKPLVLITGANQGLGFATAQQLASTGQYNLLVAARSQE